MADDVFCKDCEHSFEYTNYDNGTLYCEKYPQITNYKNFVTGHWQKRESLRCQGINTTGNCDGYEKKKPKPPKISWLKRLFTSNVRLAEQDGKLSIAPKSTGELSVTE